MNFTHLVLLIYKRGLCTVHSTTFPYYLSLADQVFLWADEASKWPPCKLGLIGTSALPDGNLWSGFSFVGRSLTSSLDMVLLQSVKSSGLDTGRGLTASRCLRFVELHKFITEFPESVFSDDSGPIILLCWPVFLLGYGQNVISVTFSESHEALSTV